MHEFFRVFTGFKISLPHFSNLGIHTIKSRNLPSTFIYNLFEFQILLFNKLHQRLNTILRHILRELRACLSLRLTISLKGLHFLPKDTNLDGVILFILGNERELM